MSTARSRYPEFFIVGAPRCGTTFLYQVLAAHPGVFMPTPKEPHYFSNDLSSGTPGDRNFFIASEDAYLRLFEPAGAGQVRGEADVLNLFSPAAAARIRAARPDARIVISLRDPVEQIRSFHNVRYRVGREGLRLAPALEAAPARAAGRRLPWKAMNLHMYDYRAVARFSEQVERYLAVFPREQLLILLLDEIRTDAAAVYARTLEHIGADAGFPLPSPQVVNESRGVRSRALLNVIRWPPLIGAAKRLVPRRFHPAWRRAVIALGEWTTNVEVDAWEDPDLRVRLREEYAPEVERLGRLLGRDLVGQWGYEAA